MAKLNALVIDDELPTARRLCSMINTLRPDWDITIGPSSISEMVKWFEKNPWPDIMFLDIKLDDGTAFDFLNEVKPEKPIVFTTAYDEYALEAFRVNGIDYLLKPIRIDRLSEAITKFERLYPAVDQDNIQKLLETFVPGAGCSYKSRFIVHKVDGMLILHTDEVSFFYSENKKTYAVTNKGVTHQLAMPLDSLMDELDPKQFFRANRQAIVNIDAIVKVEP
ncbi:MAG: LytR/AlgR family response regulator transcription factor, partial [Candidatus Cryptobacteroides sp.]